PPHAHIVLLAIREPALPQSVHGPGLESPLVLVLAALEPAVPFPLLLPVDITTLLQLRSVLVPRGPHALLPASLERALPPDLPIVVVVDPFALLLARSVKPC